MKKNILYYLFLFLCIRTQANNKLIYKTMDIIYHNTLLKDSTKIKYLELTPSEAKKLIKQFDGIESSEFSKYKVSQIFKLNDSKYVFMGKRACYLYFSKNDIIKILSSSSKSEHVLYNLNPYAKDFPNQVNIAISKMCSSLNLNKLELDYSEESLSYIDNIIINNYTKNNDFYVILKRNIMGLIAYAGELYIKKHGGQWKMILASDGETWEPYLDIKKDDMFDLYVWVQDSILNFHDDEYPSISVGYLARTNELFNKK